jgi:hypothetical protein
VSVFTHRQDVAAVCEAEIGEDGYVFPIDLDDYYGPNFLNDYRLALRYTDADALGKGTSFELPARSGKVALTQPGQEFMENVHLTQGTIVVRKQSVSGSEIARRFAGEELNMGSMRRVALDRFNYVKGGLARGDAGRRVLERSLKTVTA